MQWDWSTRCLRITSGELARFHSMDFGDTPGGGLWRAEIGQQWHQRLRQNSEKENAGWSFEVPCNGSIAHNGWTFEITGRIDQFLAGPMARVREIKTIH